jgi:hypothetical protein
MIEPGPWVEPLARIVHTIGFAILVGSIVAFDVRVLGFSRSMSVRALSKHLLPWTAGALLLILPSGVTLFALHADELLDSRVFKVKMALLLAAGINAAIFRTGPYQSVSAWDRDATPPAAARASVAASIAIWLAIIACGQLLGER